MHLFVFVGTGMGWMSCPMGTYSNQEGLYSEAQCQPCLGGKYCASEHLTTYSGVCNPGKFGLHYVQVKAITGEFLLNFINSLVSSRWRALLHL